MKEKEKMTDQEFEKMLKDKMIGLSDSVDCFDKIAERVFHEEDAEFEDDEFIVTDLENITGKKRYSPFWKGLAAGMAAVFAIAVVPKTSVFQKVMCNIGAPDTNVYAIVVNDILSNTANDSGMEFHVYDIELEEYIRKDVLVTPLYNCPFEDIGREDIRVRIFVRTYKNTLTNEIYAVEYSGEYSEKNFIAAAETKARFTVDELKECSAANMDNINYSCYDMNDSDDYINAAFIQNCIFKDYSETFRLISAIDYSTSDNGASYRYNIQNFKLSDDNGPILPYELSQNAIKWKYSVYSSGESALPQTSGSIFSPACFEENGTSDNNTDSSNNIFTAPAVIQPYIESGIKSKSMYSDIPYLSVAPVGKNIDIPVDPELRYFLALYLCRKDALYYLYSDKSDANFEISSSDGSVNRIYNTEDITYDYSISTCVDGDIDISDLNIDSILGYDNTDAEITDDEEIQKYFDGMIVTDVNGQMIISDTEKENKTVSAEIQKNYPQ